MLSDASTFEAESVPVLILNTSLLSGSFSFLALMTEVNSMYRCIVVFLLKSHFAINSARNLEKLLFLFLCIFLNAKCVIFHWYLFSFILLGIFCRRNIKQQFVLFRVEVSAIVKKYWTVPSMRSVYLVNMQTFSLKFPELW